MQQAEHTTQHTQKETVQKLYKYLSTFQKKVHFDFFEVLMNSWKAKIIIFHMNSIYSMDCNHAVYWYSYGPLSMQG